MTETDDKLKDRLRKLKTLAERGSPGERENAQVLFLRICKKYEIDIDNFKSESEVTIHWFKYIRGCKISGMNVFRKLVVQVFYKCIREHEYKVWSNPYRKFQVGVDCTRAEAIEIELDYAFYAEHLQKEMSALVEAFIQVNNIFPPNGEKSTKPLDPLVMGIATSLDSHTRTKVIGDGEE